MLTAWLGDWKIGIKFVQFQKNPTSADGVNNPTSSADNPTSSADVNNKERER